ncbi:hypothetical protein ACFLZ0_01330 [Patescibacteria group bacterium]
MTNYIKSKRIHTSYQNNRGRAILSLVVICSVFFLGILYLIQANGLVGYSYQIRQLKENLGDLQFENKELETESAQCQSPANLDKLIQPLNLIDASEVIYLNKDKSVAIIKQ